MVFQRIYHEGLAQACYLIGCSRTGQAIVIDPTRDFERIIAEAQKFGLRIVAVSETHVHADYLSGSLELSELTGAKLYLSVEGGPDWQYGFLDSSGATPISDGSSIQVGSLRLDVFKTPGHTPEHVCFLLVDEATSPKPCALISGDFIFCGDVGRPDLLETAAGHVGTMAESARSLFRSIERTSRFANDLLVWPGHGAGSACGKALSAVPVSTLGYERASSWAFKSGSEQAFVDEVLAGQPDPPAYFAMMKRLNLEGPPRRGKLSPLPTLDLADALGSAYQLVDLRSFEDFCAGHISGSISLPRYRNFITYAGSVLTFDQDIAFIADSDSIADAARHDLAMIGFDRIIGFLPSGELQNTPLESLRSAQAPEVLGNPVGFQLLDVRNRNEWESGHLEHATHIPYPSLVRRLSELDKEDPIAVFCQGGARSGTAASVLAANGFKNVIDVSDGYPGLSAMAAGERHRIPVH